MLTTTRSGRREFDMSILEIVSHDLKNPISSIAMAADFLLEELVPNDSAHMAQREQLRAIERAACRMRRLANDLLDVSAVESGELRLYPCPVAVELLLADVFDVFQLPAASKKVLFAVDAESRLPCVFADRDRVGQVLSNLVANALRFTPGGGRILVCAGRSADHVEFSVLDSGCGISADDLPHVFDRLWQSPRSARLGNGLGLSIAKGIIEAHGGQLVAHSVVDEGSAFSFTLPIAACTTDPKEDSHV